MTEDLRTTIRDVVTFEGIGLHSGQHCEARLAPAPPDHGLRINGARVGLDAVVERPLCTTLMTAAGPIATVEHLLAAVWGLGIDDLDITVRGDEVPILDGSIAPWIEGLTLRSQPGVRRVLGVKDTIEIVDGDRWIRASAAGDLILEVDVEYPELGRHRCRGTLADIGRMASARTFGFERDAEALRAAGLARGADLSNTLVFDGQGRPLNAGGLRHPDEVARHKWLDLVGDLALLGAPLHARIQCRKGGHGLHRAMVKRILDQIDDELS